VWLQRQEGSLCKVYNLHMAPHGCSSDQSCCVGSSLPGTPIPDVPGERHRSGTCRDGGHAVW